MTDYDARDADRWRDLLGVKLADHELRWMAKVERAERERIKRIIEADNAAVWSIHKFAKGRLLAAIDGGCDACGGRGTRTGVRGVPCYKCGGEG